VPFGFVNYRGKEDEINIQNFKMGDKYVEAFSHGLQYASVKKVNLASNRLDDKGAL
jgi:hypothetical protein